MSKMTDTEISVIIFLLAVMCIIAIAVGVMVWTMYSTDNDDDLDAILDDYETLQSDYTHLQASKAAIEQDNIELSAQNDKLTDAVRTLNDENRELFRELAELQKAHETGENPGAAGSSQRESISQYERLPENIDTNRYDCEGYKFGAGSDQARLQLDCATDPETGIRYWRDINGKMYYCAAMGAAYGTEIGRCFDVTLQCGTTFGVILSDFQHDISDPDPDDFGEIWLRDKDGKPIERLRNADGELVVHVLEFVCDLQRVPRAAYKAGTMSELEKFGGRLGDGGNIVKIKHLGRKWEP